MLIKLDICYVGHRYSGCGIIDIVDVGYMNMRDISVVGMWENRYSECGIIDIVDVGYIDMRG